MKHIRAWLLPLFTLLTVLAVTVLPRYLSDLQDQKIIGHIHTEKLPTENSFLTQQPDLSQRMLLLSQWAEGYDVMTVQNEIKESGAHTETAADSENAAYHQLCSTVLAELNALTEIGLLPLDLMPLEASNMNVSRMYLQQQLIRAEFYVFETYMKAENIHLLIVLDSETMNMVWLELGHPAMEKYYKSISPEEIGRFFLERLDVNCDLVTAGEFDAVFQITDADLQYWVSVEPYFLKIFPTTIPVMDAEKTHSSST